MMVGLYCESSARQALGLCGVTVSPEAMWARTPPPLACLSTCTSGFSGAALGSTMKDLGPSDGSWFWGD